MRKHGLSIVFSFKGQFETIEIAMSAHRILGVEKTLSSLLNRNVEVINVLKTVKAFKRFSYEFLGG